MTGCLLVSQTATLVNGSYSVSIIKTRKWPECNHYIIKGIQYITLCALLVLVVATMRPFRWDATPMMATTSNKTLIFHFCILFKMYIRKVQCLYYVASHDIFLWFNYSGNLLPGYITIVIDIMGVHTHVLCPHILCSEFCNSLFQVFIIMWCFMFHEDLMVHNM